MKGLLALLEKLLEGPRRQYHGVLGVYYYVDDVEDTVRALRGMGHTEIVVKSPVPHHSIEQALGQGSSLVRWITATGAVIGCTCGFALCFFSVYSWPLVVGGKELASLPPFVIIGYESMILIGCLSNLLGMLALGRLPQVLAPSPYDPRFSEDKIGVWVPCAGAEAERARELMKGHGAEEVKLHA